MSVIIKDFFQLGALRFTSRVLVGIRGLFVVISLAPHTLGEYTIWLLFIFYFSMLDFGVLAGLERDLPHYRGLGKVGEAQKQSDLGWSTFFNANTKHQRGKNKGKYKRTGQGCEFSPN